MSAPNSTLEETRRSAGEHLLDQKACDFSVFNTEIRFSSLRQGPDLPGELLNHLLGLTVAFGDAAVVPATGQGRPSKRASSHLDLGEHSRANGRVVT